MFEGGTIPLSFHLVDTQLNTTGAVLHVYERTGSLKYGEVEVGQDQDRHRGLNLAEMELENQTAASELDFLAFGFKDVTADPFFTGSSLAMMTDEEFIHGLSQRLQEYGSAK